MDAVHGLRGPGRALATVGAQTEKHQFLAGTCVLNGENEIRVLEFDDTTNQLRPKHICKHVNEILHISSCPKRPDLFATVRNSGSGSIATLWRDPVSVDEVRVDEPIALDTVTEMSGGAPGVRAVVWHPSESESSVVIVSDEALYVSDVGAETLQQVAGPTVRHGGDAEPFVAGTWDPHHAKQFVSVGQRCIRGWDLRASKEVQTVRNAHEDPINDVDYNPNKPYHVVTGGEDRQIRFWDLRKPAEPLKLIRKHTHWVTQVKYNRFHDQLVLSAGSDALLNLWSLVSISSAPLGDLEDPANEKQGDKHIQTFDQHEDSIYGVAWSACDAWVFASLSYDGHIVVNHVPAAEKYKILL